MAHAAQDVSEVANPVYTYFCQWRDDQTWQRIHDTLRADVRRTAKRHKHPTAGCLDSQSVQTGHITGELGFDASKRVKGRKCHLLVDPMGLLLAVVVTSAAPSDGAGARRLLARPGGSCKKVCRIWVDGSYRNGLQIWVRATLWFVLETMMHAEKRSGFRELPRRRVVEHTFAWLTRCRRLTMDYGCLTTSSEAFICLAMTRLMLRRLASRCFSNRL